MDLSIDEASGTNAFPCQVLSLMITGTEHDMLTKFLKMKPQTFQGTEYENPFEFVMDCYERLHKMGIVRRLYAECRSPILPSLTWE